MKVPFISQRARAVVFTGFIALFLTFAGKFFAFVKDVAFSFYFGAGMSTDAYFIANMIPGIMWATFQITINIVFLPLYVNKMAQGERASGKFAAEAVQIYALLGLVIAAICVAFAGPIVHLTAPDASAATLELARILTIVMAGGFIFSGYVAVQNAIQQAHGYYQSPLAVPVINNLLAIIGIVIAAYFQDIRIAVAVAVLAWVVQSPIQRLQTRRFYKTPRRFLVRGETMRQFGLLSAPVMLGTFLDQINIYVGLYLASGLGTGAISQLNYASRLAVFLASIFSTLAAYFLFPRLAAAAATDDDTQTAGRLGIGVLIVLITTLPLTILSVALREDMIAIIYGRGALTAADIIDTASAFAYFAFGIVFVAVRELFNRLFFAHQRNVVPLVIGGVAFFANLGASLWLSQKMGLAGIALGASVGAVTYLLGQVLVVVRWKPALLGRELRRGLLSIGLAAVPAWLSLEAILPLLAGMSPFGRILVAGTAFAISFLAVLLPVAWIAGLRPRDLAL